MTYHFLKKVLNFQCNRCPYFIEMNEKEVIEKYPNLRKKIYDIFLCNIFEIYISPDDGINISNISYKLKNAVDIKMGD